VATDYVEYMMGHKISTYHDVQMKGIEFLRGIYAASGLSVKPKTRIIRIEALKEMVRAFGLDPEKVLVKEALAEPHRTVIDPYADWGDFELQTLTSTLKEALKQEVLAGARAT